MMTIPTLMNCGHSEDGWCLACVRDLAQQVEDLEGFRKEIIACSDLAQLLDSRNPELKGSFTGVPSERIARQVEDLQKDAARLDWLEASKESHGFCHKEWGEYRYYAHQIEDCPTVRQVIDEAMQACATNA
jgi:hypothetical protein